MNNEPDSRLHSLVLGRDLIVYENLGGWSSQVGFEIGIVLLLALKVRQIVPGLLKELELLNGFFFVVDVLVRMGFDRCSLKALLMSSWGMAL